MVPNHPNNLNHPNDPNNPNNPNNPNSPNNLHHPSNPNRKNPDYGNFDNIFNALLTLIEVSSMEMWPLVYIRACDLPNDYNEAPIKDNSGASMLYFFIGIIVMNFIIVNLFVGAVVDTFNQTMAETTGTMLLN